MAGDKNKNGLFIIDRDVFLLACDAGLNAAVSYLIMARGTQGNNRTTKWSSNSIAKYAGITRFRAQIAVDQLIAAGVTELVTAGTRPQYKMSLPDGDKGYIYLPNSIVDGVGSEIPPVERIRQTRKLDYLKAFILCYFIHDLDEYGGLPLNMFTGQSSELVTLYQNDVMKVIGCESSTWGLNWSWYAKDTVFSAAGIEFNDFFDAIKVLRSMGLLSPCAEVFDSPDEDGEWICSATDYASVKDLDTQIRRHSKTLKKWPDSWFYMVIPTHAEPCIKTVARMEYRPHTTKTARWVDRHQKGNSRRNEMLRSAINMETAKAAERSERKVS